MLPYVLHREAKNPVILILDGASTQSRHGRLPRKSAPESSLRAIPTAVGRRSNPCGVPPTPSCPRRQHFRPSGLVRVCRRGTWPRRLEDADIVDHVRRVSPEGQKARLLCPRPLPAEAVGHGRHRELAGCFARVYGGEGIHEHLSPSGLTYRIHILYNNIHGKQPVLRIEELTIDDHILDKLSSRGFGFCLLGTLGLSGVWCLGFGISAPGVISRRY